MVILVKYDSMRGLNKATLIGNLGNEPHFQLLENNIALAKFSLATTDSYKDANGQLHNETEWHQVLAWRNLAELARKFLKKGSTVYLEGKIKTRSYDDTNGVKRYVTEIIAESIILLDKKEDS